MAGLFVADKTRDRPDCHGTSFLFTALPGVITLDLFGHEIELLPRVLIVNKKEVPWQSGLSLVLSPTNKPAIPPKPPTPRKGLSR